MAHDFANFQHGAALGRRSQGAPPFRWFGEFLGGQAIVLGPLLFLYELWVLAKTMRKGQQMTEAERFLVAFAAPILLLCLVVSLQSKIEANWPAPAHITGLIVVAASFSMIWQQGNASKRAAIAAASGLSAVLVSVLLFPQVVPLLGIRASADLAQKANETYGWPELMRQIQTARQRLEAEGKPVFVAGINYRVPSLLAFYLPDKPETVELFFATRRDDYFYRKERRLLGQNALLCLDNDKPEAIALARRYFARVTEEDTAFVSRPGFSGPVKQWKLYFCHDFKGYDRSAHIEGW